jgi:hypothetical protein
MAAYYTVDLRAMLAAQSILFRGIHRTKYLQIDTLQKPRSMRSITLGSMPPSWALIHRLLTTKTQEGPKTSPILFQSG